MLVILAKNFGKYEISLKIILVADVTFVAGIRFFSFTFERINKILYKIHNNLLLNKMNRTITI